MKNMIFVSILISIVLISGCVKEEQPIVCANDTKLCPDGTYVVRIPPECEFEECPEPIAEETFQAQGCVPDFAKYVEGKIEETEETEYSKCYNGDLCFTLHTTPEDSFAGYELWQILLSATGNRETRKDFSNVKFKCILENDQYTCDYTAAPAIQYTVMLKKGDQKIILDQPIILDLQKNVIDMSCTELS